jgi:tetratricopeptide (TPR) repeat protein/YHS domain-containing protein
MNKLSLLLLLFFALTTRAQDDKKGNIFTNANDGAKMLIAKQKLYGGSYTSALNIYHEIEKNNPGNATVKYYIGLCHFNLGQGKEAKQKLEEALAINKDIKPETYFLLARMYHTEGNVDKAIELFNTFKNLPDGEQESKRLTELYLAQCNNATQLMKNPLDVNIENMGAGVNSKYDDKNPCITADGRLMVFTTRRPENTTDEVDSEGDGKYFENIYASRPDSLTGQFASASALDKHVNTKAHDACTSISPDGKQLFLYKNDINNRASRGGNVFVSKQLSGKWKTPEPVGKPINNASSWEGGACISPDGKRYFFSSEREGGYGGSDIWMVVRKNKKEWGEPVNLGPTVNTAYDEAGMFLAPDGKTLFFCSNGPKSIGGYDILRTVFENGQWSEALNVGYPINSTGKEGQLTVGADMHYAYLSSDRPGGIGESDLYKVDLKEFAILEKDGKKKTSNGLSILRGTIREGYEGYGIEGVEIAVKDTREALVESTVTDEKGEYFITMHAGAYTLHVNKKGFKEIVEGFEVLPQQKGTPVIEKGYLLKKEGHN